MVTVPLTMDLNLNKEPWVKSTGTSTGSGSHTSFRIPQAQTPILTEIARYARRLAPEILQWGRAQHGAVNVLAEDQIRRGKLYASPGRISQDMGEAQAHVMQAGEASRQAAERDLQGMGIDTSGGRYADLQMKARGATTAAAAGAGNVRRAETERQGMGMVDQGIQTKLANNQFGNEANRTGLGFLGTAMQLPYEPLGQRGTNAQTSTQTSYDFMVPNRTNPYEQRFAAGGGVEGLDLGEETMDDATSGGFVSKDMSPSNGAATDDVPAKLNADEFVIPKDVAMWKGQEFFWKLIKSAREARLGKAPEAPKQAKPEAPPPEPEPSVPEVAEMALGGPVQKFRRGGSAGGGGGDNFAAHVALHQGWLRDFGHGNMKPTPSYYERANEDAKIKVELERIAAQERIAAAQQAGANQREASSQAGATARDTAAGNRKMMGFAEGGPVEGFNPMDPFAVNPSWMAARQEENTEKLDQQEQEERKKKLQEAAGFAAGGPVEGYDPYGGSGYDQFFNQYAGPKDYLRRPDFLEQYKQKPLSLMTPVKPKPAVAKPRVMRPGSMQFLSADTVRSGRSVMGSGGLRGIG